MTPRGDVNDGGGRRADMSDTYTPRWRDKVRDGARSSADVLAPVIVDLFHPRTIVDVGCGEGWLADALQVAGGGSVVGVDGPWVRDAVTVDLSAPPYPHLGPFDVAVSLEVAEHVPADHAVDLVAWLVDLAPVVVFSAAVPGQGGEGHINEQPPGYWRDLFAGHGYAGSGALRWAVWTDERISWWYRQNLLVFGGHDLPHDGCPHLIHPGAWAHKGHG